MCHVRLSQKYGEWDTLQKEIQATESAINKSSALIAQLGYKRSSLKYSDLVSVRYSRSFRTRAAILIETSQTDGGA